MDDAAGERRASTRPTCARRCWRRSTSPAACASIWATCDARASPRAAKIVEATYSTPYLPRARMEPGNATVLVTNDRVDIWIGDQSPQETRFSAAKITGIPETERLPPPVPPRRRLRPQRQRPAGRAGDHDRQPEPRHAHPPAVDARGGLHRHDLSRHGRGAAAARRSTPTAGRSRSRCAPRMQRDGFGPDASFDVASRYYVPNYRFSTHTTKFHIPVGTRRGVGQAGARVLSRELHRRARPRGRQGPVPLSPRADRPHRTCPTRPT